MQKKDRLTLLRKVSTMKRRMAAILVADVVGYSGLMEADEDGTARRLAACRNLIDTEIAKCEGRLFKAMGDAVLVEFASSDQRRALRRGHSRRGQRWRSRGDAHPLRMRFGLHLADVLVQDDDLIGDGVNLAARIQQSADPDAIDVSGALFDTISRNSPFAFDDRGERRFRNIVEPVRIYRLRGEINRHVYQIAPTQLTPTQAKRPHSLAVMPIEVAAGNEDQTYLADGVTEELIFELGAVQKTVRSFALGDTRSQRSRVRSTDRGRPVGGALRARRHDTPARAADPLGPLAFRDRNRRSCVERSTQRKP